MVSLENLDIGPRRAGGWRVIIAANAPKKGFNRTPESSGPAKPGEFGGAAG